MTSRVASLSTGAPFRMPVKEEEARFAYFPPGIPGSLKYAACPAPTARPRSAAEQRRAAARARRQRIRDRKAREDAEVLAAAEKADREGV